jgi:hypothetical protein
MKIMALNGVSPSSLPQNNNIFTEDVLDYSELIGSVVRRRETHSQSIESVLIYFLR